MVLPLQVREQETFMNVPFLPCVLQFHSRNSYNAYLELKMKSDPCGVRDQGANIAVQARLSSIPLLSRSPKWTPRKMQ
jgi:hypothetical protein